MTTNGGKGKPPTKERQQKKSKKSTRFVERTNNVRKRGRGRRKGRKEGKCYSPSAKTMSKISLLLSFDERVSPVAVPGVEDLESSWVITGMAIVVNGMTMTSRKMHARKRPPEIRRGKGTGMI